MEMVDSVDDLRSSSSIRGISMPNFEVLDARIASALNKIIHNSHFKRRISLEEHKAQKQDRFLRGRQIAYLIYDHFRVTGSHDSVENYTDLFTISLRNDDVQEFDAKWDGILLSVTKIPHDDILEGLYKLRIRESDKLKTVLEMYDLEIILKKGDWHERGLVTDQFHDRSGKPDKRSDKKLGQKSSQRRSTDARQLGCVFQDMTPPKSILLKCTDMRKPIQRVKFTNAIARHTKIRDQHPSLGYIRPGEPHERSPNAPKFEDRSQEETEWQEQGAREAAWKLAKSVLKLKEHERATFFSPSENRCLPVSALKPEEREFVVDSGASMHMISKKDLSDAEMDTLTKSCSPTTVITANEEVQTHEEATVYVKELDIFLTMKVLENTPAVLSLGKLCDENGYSCEWINGQNHISLKTGFEYIVTRRTSFRLWYQACQVHLLDRHRPQRHL